MFFEVVIKYEAYGAVGQMNWVKHGQEVTNGIGERINHKWTGLNLFTLEFELFSISEVVIVLFCPLIRGKRLPSKE